MCWLRGEFLFVCTASLIEKVFKGSMVMANQKVLLLVLDNIYFWCIDSDNWAIGCLNDQSITTCKSCTYTMNMNSRFICKYRVFRRNGFNTEMVYLEPQFNEPKELRIPDSLTRIDRFCKPSLDFSHFRDVIISHCFGDFANCNSFCAKSMKNGSIESANLCKSRINVQWINIAT